MHFIEISTDPSRWGSLHFNPDEFEVASLPSVNCTKCNAVFAAPALPHAKEILTLHEGLVGVDRNSKASNSSMLVLHSDETHRSVTRLEFNHRKDLLRKLLSLEASFPILPGARMFPLILRWRVKAIPSPIASSTQDTTILFCRDAVEELTRREFTGVVWNLVQNNPHSRAEVEMYEMVVVGSTDPGVADIEIEDAIAKEFEEPNRGQFRRCSECGSFPYRVPYTLTKPLTSTHDAVRLQDFRGIYVSERLSRFLQELTCSELRFNEV